MSDQTTSGARVGRTLLELGRAEEAIELLGQAVAQDPENVAAHCELSLALIHARRHRDALRMAQSAVALDPDEEWPHRLRAIALQELGRKRDAEEAARESVRLAPEQAEAHFVLASILAQRHKLADARAAVAHAVELAPEDASMHLIVADVASEQKDYAAAEQSYLRALALDPTDYAAHNNYGTLLMQTGRRTAARKAFARAAQLNPRQDASRRNTTALARDFIAGGGWLFAVGIWATIRLAIDVPQYASGELTLDIPTLVGALVFGFVVIALWRRHRERQLPAVERALIQDERRRFRRRPWTWRPQTYYLPVPIWLLVKVPVPILFACSAVGLVASVATTDHYSGGRAVWIGVLLALTIWTGVLARRWALRRGWLA